MFANLSLDTVLRWFKTLFYSEKDCVVECFNGYRFGFRFLWKGTVYAESYNSEYSPVIANSKTPLPDIPLTMCDEIRDRILLEERQDKAPFTTDYMQLKESNLIYSDECREEFINSINRYAFQKFHATSLLPAEH